MIRDARGRAGSGSAGSESAGSDRAGSDRAGPDWDARADAAQSALGGDFGSRFARMRVRNGSRVLSVHPFTFNYWWFAHLIEVRVDAFVRSGEQRRLDEAEDVLRRLRRRNGGILPNDYFDDMGWLAIALVRLHEASGRAERLDDAVALWREIDRAGWNDTEGPSVAWRRSQPGYKNAPSTGTFAIASAMLARITGDSAFSARAEAGLAWLESRLLRSDGLVADGVNRLGDGAVDRDWLFSYNQGLYIGALVATADAPGPRATGPDAAAGPHAAAAAGRLDRALRTATAAIDALAPTGVITGENADLRRPGGADLGLFKGVLIRYLGELVARLPPTEERSRVVGFIATGTDALWHGMARSGSLRAGDDWSRPTPPVTALSTQLSALIALETRARLSDRDRDRDRIRLN